MFVCVSPSESDAGESLCSLNFAGRVRNVELGPAKRKAEGGGKAAAEQARKAAEEADRRESRIRQLEAELQQQAAAGVGSLRAACLPAALSPAPFFCIFARRRRIHLIPRFAPQPPPRTPPRWIWSGSWRSRARRRRPSTLAWTGTPSRSLSRPSLRSI